MTALQCTVSQVYAKSHLGVDEYLRGTVVDAGSGGPVAGAVVLYVPAGQDGTEYVLTDSFHGSVFSIIFHRPFVALGNAGRGQARFHSLLGLFGLEDRLVTTGRAEEVAARLREPIDWARVDRIKREWQVKSTEFLRKALGEDGK